MTMPNTEFRGSGTESAGQQGGGSAREQIREVKDQVVGQARSSLEQARNRASSSLGESKGQFADQFGTIAEALRRTTEHLRSEDQQRIAGITDTVARQVDQVANYLRNKDAMAMRSDLENLARRQPALVLGRAPSGTVVSAASARSTAAPSVSGMVVTTSSLVVTLSSRAATTSSLRMPSSSGRAHLAVVADTREAAMPALRTEDRSIGELFGQLTQDMTLLVRQEVQLARVEMSDKISRVTTNVISVAAGGFVAYLGGLALVAALILAIRDLANISLAVSALIVGAVLAVIGYVMLQRGMKELKRVDLAPRRTVETLKDDVQWAKEQRS
jgi:hypothetical protein